MPTRQPEQAPQKISVQEEEKTHEIFLKNKKALKITGVKSVKTYDKHDITMETHAGGLIIGGENLHIKRLDLEEELLLVEGVVNNMIYNDSKKQKSKNLLKRLFQ